jgi:hypothetical protein
VGCCECGDEPSGSGATELLCSSMVSRHIARKNKAVFYLSGVPDQVSG